MLSTHHTHTHTQCCHVITHHTRPHHTHTQTVLSCYLACLQVCVCLTIDCLCTFTCHCLYYYSVRVLFVLTVCFPYTCCITDSSVFFYFTDVTTYSVSQLTFGTIAVNVFKKIHQFVCYNVDCYIYTQCMLQVLP